VTHYLENYVWPWENIDGPLSTHLIRGNIEIPPRLSLESLKTLFIKPFLEKDNPLMEGLRLLLGIPHFLTEAQQPGESTFA
jgi:hypothetical protein